MNSQKNTYSAVCREWQLPVFVQDWYLDAVCTNGSWDVVIVEENGLVKGVFPFFYKKKWGLRYLSMPNFCKYMGPYLHPEISRLEDQHRILNQLIEQLPELDYLVVNTYYTLTNWLPFYWKNYQQTTRYSYEIPLDDLELIYKNLNRNIRRNIKKAKAELIITSSDELERFYELNQLSFQRQGLTPPYTFSELQQHDKALERHKARQLFFAKDQDGRLHSGAYLIWDHERAYYHLSGDHPELRKSGAGILLVWHAIKYAAEELQLPVFDFEGSMLPPVEAIRRQFGARQVPYFTLSWYRKPWIKALREWSV